MCLASQNTHFRHKSYNLSASQNLEPSSGEPGHMLSICVCGLAEEQPWTRCIRQCSGRTRGRNLPMWLFVLPSFHPAAAPSARCQLEVKRWKPRPPQLPRVHVNHYITFTRHTERHKDGSKSQFEAWLGCVWLLSFHISGHCNKAMKDY